MCDILVWCAVLTGVRGPFASNEPLENSVDVSLINIERAKSSYETDQVNEHGASESMGMSEMKPVLQFVGSIINPDLTWTVAAAAVPFLRFKVILRIPGHRTRRVVSLFIRPMQLSATRKQIKEPRALESLSLSIARAAHVINSGYL